MFVVHGAPTRASSRAGFSLGSAFDGGDAFLGLDERPAADPVDGDYAVSDQIPADPLREADEPNEAGDRNEITLLSGTTILLH